MKKCSRCKIDKDDDQYSRNSGYISGFNGRCKACVSKINKAYTDKNKGNRKSLRKNEGVTGRLPNCLYKEGTNLITNVYPYKSNNR